MKEGETISKGSAMDGQTMGKIITKLLRIFKDLKSSDVWETLQDHWKLCQKKYYARGDNQDEDSRAPEEECVASDEDDWKIDMPEMILRKKVWMMTHNAPELEYN
jgi:hypothetical protein